MTDATTILLCVLGFVGVVGVALIPPSTFASTLMENLLAALTLILTFLFIGWISILAGIGTVPAIIVATSAILFVALHWLAA